MRRNTAKKGQLHEDKNTKQKSRRETKAELGEERERAREREVLISLDPFVD